ncbi:MAG: T9SS type A sorting domain-containing protein [Bacteroidetes bacterium]|nr:T9SS type A sorting domain-containing protein [Bacteroidota bacterium]
MIKKLLLSVSLLLSISNMSGQAFSLYYPFTNATMSTSCTDPTPSPTATGVMSGSFTANGVCTGTYVNGGSGYWNWGGFTVGYASVTPTDTYSAMTGSIDLTRNYEVVLTPQSGYKISLVSMSFQASRNNRGPRSWVVRTSGDNFTANAIASYTPLGAAASASTPVIQILTSPANTFFWSQNAVYSSTAMPQAYMSNNVCGVTFTGAGISNITNSVSIRMYAWNSVGSGTVSSGLSSGTWRIDSVLINGTAMLATGLANISHNLNAPFKLYPNPSNDGLVDLLVSESAASKVEVINTLGALVASQNINENEANIRLNLSTLPAGTYFVRMTTASGFKTEKLVITSK